MAIKDHPIKHFCADCKYALRRVSGKRWGCEYPRTEFDYVQGIEVPSRRVYCDEWNASGECRDFSEGTPKEADNAD